MLFPRFFATLFFALFLTLLAGCGQKGPDVQYVEGIVTIDGKPVEAATVNFAPLVESSDLSGTLLGMGRTDVHGKYTLSTNRGSIVGGGTTVGEYKVSIVKKEVTNAPTEPLLGGQSWVPKFLYHVPKVFEDARTSPLTVEIVRGKNVFHFALKSDGTFEITK